MKEFYPFIFSEIRFAVTLDAQRNQITWGIISFCVICVMNAQNFLPVYLAAL
jgi:hypothetical protein